MKSNPYAALIRERERGRPKIKMISKYYIDSFDIFHLRQIGRGYEHHIGSEFGRAQNFERLRLHVQDGNEALFDDVSYGLELRAVHGVLVRAVLEILVIGNVAHHFFGRHKKVVFAVLFVFSWQTCRVYQTRGEEKSSKLFFEAFD